MVHPFVVIISATSQQVKWRVRDVNQFTVIFVNKCKLHIFYKLNLIEYQSHCVWEKKMRSLNYKCLSLTSPCERYLVRFREYHLSTIAVQIKQLLSENGRLLACHSVLMNEVPNSVSNISMRIFDSSAKQRPGGLSVLNQSSSKVFEFLVSSITNISKWLITNELEMKSLTRSVRCGDALNRDATWR